MESTFAHLMSPMMLAFAKPLNGGPHPGPWKATSGGSSHDITAQISIPLTGDNDRVEALRLGATIVSLMRLRCDPAITMVAFSSLPFDSLKNLPDTTAPVVPLEVYPRFIPLMNAGGEKASQTIGWVKSHFETAIELRSKHQEFRVASAALDAAQFIQNDALALISLWGALEALFSPSTSELKFRVSALIAAYLHKPGIARLEAQRNIAKLYDKRSSAAHGKPRHVQDDLVASFILLRSCIMKMILEREVPTKEKLERLLFGDE
ncbi:HEPN domain-containing protein [Brucella thiophenivorans]|uniref:HEPN domain-containing protein n=1 Tax=Brucella thiophenivorans TaxID=571255 RepID=UPI001180DC70|nr:HEPN domain-containing protein [Brucella thiophenivorans]